MDLTTSTEKYLANHTTAKVTQDLQALIVLAKTAVPAGVDVNSLLYLYLLTHS